MMNKYRRQGDWGTSPEPGSVQWRLATGQEVVDTI